MKSEKEIQRVDRNKNQIGRWKDRVTLLAFGSADPCTEERYDIGKFRTYQGRALAIIRAEVQGKMEIIINGMNLSGTTAEISVMGL